MGRRQCLWCISQIRYNKADVNLTTWLSSCLVSCTVLGSIFHTYCQFYSYACEDHWYVKIKKNLTTVKGFHDRISTKKSFCKKTTLVSSEIIWKLRWRKKQEEQLCRAEHVIFTNIFKKWTSGSSNCFPVILLLWWHGYSLCFFSFDCIHVTAITYFHGRMSSL